MTFIILFLSAAFAAGPKELLVCKGENLIRKNCILQNKNYELLINKDKILINNYVWRTIADTPMKALETEWSDIKLVTFGKRSFVEFKIWGPRQGESNMQSLHWILVELLGRKTELRLDKIVQKRRPNDTTQAKTKHLSDKPEKHTLKQLKNGHIEWQVAHDKDQF